MKGIVAFIRGIWVRSILVGLLAVLVSVGVSWLDHGQDHRKVDHQAWQYWTAYFTQFYKTQGVSIDKKQLAANVAQYSEHLHLVLWDASHQVLFTNQAMGPYDEHGQVLYVDGKVVGAFMVNMKEPFTLTPFQWVPIWLGGVLTALIYAWQVSRIRGRHQREQKEITKRLRNMAPEASRDEDISLLLDRLSNRLHQLEKVRKTMVADIAHELRTPLAVMRAQLENDMAHGTPMPPEKMVRVYDEVYRMSKLVNDLQQLVLAESGELPLERQWFDLSELLQKVVEILDGDAEEAGKRLSVQTTSPCSLYADLGRVQQILINLIGNAIRYARSEVRIVVASDPHAVRIEITDDGQGIEEEELPYLFERFYRGTSGTSNTARSEKRATGLGLGLAIVKEYVHAHQGTVTVQSVWNEGTTFTIILPILTDS